VDKKLVALIADLFEMKQEDITSDLTVEDVDVWDSLKHIELVVTIEQTFGVELTYDEIANMHHMKEIEQILRNKGVVD
jgi:acyl carrier protein